MFAGASVLIGGPFALWFVLSPWATLAVYSIAAAICGILPLATTARAYVQLAGEGAADDVAALAQGVAVGLRG